MKKSDSQVTASGKPETDVPSNFSFIYKEQIVNGLPMAYYESGEGDPILYLHGIPTNSDGWRNIVPVTASQGRSIAVDLAGYGKSGIPSNNDYSIQSQYSYIKGFIEGLRLDNITLVVNDLGSLFGLKYAVENPQRIRRIAFIEAAFMPPDLWYKQLILKQKMMFLMMSFPRLAALVIVKKNKIPAMMMKMAVIRKLNATELGWYLGPFKKEIERRNVMLYGPGPATFPAKGISKSDGDFADELNKVATGLKIMNATTPFLLFQAFPGMITRKPAIEYATANFKNLTLVQLGKGKHFLQEDHPRAIARALNEWINRTS